MNSLFVRITLFILPALLMLGCRQSPKCWGDDKNTGIMGERPDIFCAPLQDRTLYVFDNDSLYQQGFEKTIGAFSCKLPAIDFNANTLLGLKVESGGCKDKWIRSVTKDEKSRRYHYKILVRECGACKVLSTSYNWVLVPKLPTDWQVTSEIQVK